MLHKLCCDVVEIQAQDFDKDPQTGRFTHRSTPHAADKNTYLTRLLSVAPKARVMLMQNIDVSDGLVNGVFGTVCKIKFHEDETFPKIMYSRGNNYLTPR